MNQSHPTTFKAGAWLVTWDEDHQHWQATHERFLRPVVGAHAILSAMLTAAQQRRERRREQ